MEHGRNAGIRKHKQYFQRSEIKSVRDTGYVRSKPAERRQTEYQAGTKMHNNFSCSVMMLQSHIWHDSLVEQDVIRVPADNYI